MTYQSAGALLRDVRSRHGISQATLARRANTSQRHVSRIERGDVAPSTDTLARLLAALGQRLELAVAPGPADNRSQEELRADFAELTPAERLAQTSALSRSLTAIAGGRHGA